MKDRPAVTSRRFVKADSMKKMPPYPGCFVCGKGNPIGFNLDFFQKGDEVYSEFIPDNIHQGFRGIFHGGLLTAILDDAMWRVPYLKRIITLTAKIEVRFRQPVPTRKKIFVTARLDRMKGKRIVVKSWARDENDAVLAEGTGLFLRAPRALQDDPDIP
jgi:acyl-coenzyme A thioesterase PaaI-like protein